MESGLGARVESRLGPESAARAVVRLAERIDPIRSVVDPLRARGRDDEWNVPDLDGSAELAPGDDQPIRHDRDGGGEPALARARQRNRRRPDRGSRRQHRQLYLRGLPDGKGDIERSLRVGDERRRHLIAAVVAAEKDRLAPSPRGVERRDREIELANQVKFFLNRKLK